MRKNWQPVQTNQTAQLVVWIIVCRPYLHHLAKSEASRVDQNTTTRVDNGQVVSHMTPCYMGDIMIIGNRGP
jgi:hypothetical protein